MIKERANEGIKPALKALARKAGAVAIAASLSIGAGAAISSSTNQGISASAAAAACTAQDNLVSSTAAAPRNRRIAVYDSKAMAALQGMYDQDTGLFNNAAQWQQPFILSTIMNYSELSGNYRYMSDVCRTFVLNKASGFSDSYNDDNGWWALAWIKAYNMTRDSMYLAASESLFKGMSASWSRECGGGIPWTTSGPYKNSISNELFMRVGIGLYLATGDRWYLSQAIKDYSWFMSKGLINGSNQVLDGLDRNCRPGGGIWTYNSGEMIGVLTDLARATGNRADLAKAEAIANSIDSSSVNRKGMLIEIGCSHTKNCNIDFNPSQPAKGSFTINSSEFNGIYMMNLYGLYLADHNTAYLGFILKNANSIVSNDKNKNHIIGMNWSVPSHYIAAIEGSTQAAGITVLNAGQ
jgi:hypothetical protein